MSSIAPILESLQQSDDYELKCRLSEYLLNNLQSSKLTPADGELLCEFVFEQFTVILKAIPAAPDYKTKDTIMGYENLLLGMLMQGCKDPRSLSTERQEMIRTMVELVEKERFFENSVDAMLKEEVIYPAYVERVLNQHKELTDEYQKGQLYQGLIHYEEQLPKIPEQGRALIATRLADEIRRYLSGTLTETVCNNLEFLADLAKHFPTAEVIDALYSLLKLNRAHIGFYVLDSLLEVGADIPADAVSFLANDLPYADLVYRSLKSHGKEDLFPTELNNELYLAKSNLVRWLTYPTELGKEPDEIEFLGKVKVKKENFHIFRYKSDSDNLAELKNQWLIGWSGDQGGTFSNFDRYELYEKKTVEKTVKYIKKKLL